MLMERRNQKDRLKAADGGGYEPTSPNEVRMNMVKSVQGKRELGDEGGKHDKEQKRTALETPCLVQVLDSEILTGEGSLRLMIEPA